MIDPNPYEPPTVEYTPCQPIEPSVMPAQPKRRQAVYLLQVDDLFALAGCVVGIVVSSVLNEPLVMRQFLWWVSVVAAVFVFWRSRRIEEV